VVSRRGQGSYGVIYLAEPVGQEGAGPVALKLALHAGDERFEREVELLSRLKHPHVPRLLDSGTWTAGQGASFPFLVMEWVEGMPLYGWATRHKLTSLQALSLLAQVARALAATHEVEGLHRDVKGDNVLVAEGGHAVLMDFGSASYLGARVLTRPKVPVGTPQYWSPDAQLFQWMFERSATARYEADPADDVYALGVMAYRLVTGEYPPEALVWETDGDMPRLASAERVQPEALVTVCPELAVLIRQMLSEKPSARGSAAEVAQALEHAAKTAGRKAKRPITRRRKRVAAARRKQLGLRRPVVAWLGWLTAAAMGVALAVRGGETEYAEPVEPPAQVAQEEGGTDGKPADLADDALAAREGPELPKPEKGGLRREMPKKLLPNQRRPPCGRHETEINGKCWIGVRDATLPCGETYYDWKDGCYWPAPASPRPPTSEHP
jgi:hypothetical protein